MKLLSRSVPEIMVCDYCRHRKCKWSEHGAGDPPSMCMHEAAVEIADDYIGREEFGRRVKLVKGIASYDPEERRWYLDPTVRGALTGSELMRVMEEEVNGWSKKNEFILSDLVEYVEVGFEDVG